MRFVKERFALLITAAFAFCWAVARARIQSVVIDEADSYFLFVQSGALTQWWPSSGNHVLNTLLVRLATSLFGLSEFTLRMPALLGALAYISGCARICILMTEQKLLRLLVFVCLVYNPFVCDYLVAARGYALATGFFVCALAAIASAVLVPRGRTELVRLCVFASIFAGLSFTANFSFGLVDAVTLLVFLAWAAIQDERRRAVSVATACIVPASLITLFVCGSTLRDWPKGQLYYGAHTVAELWKGLIASSFDELNPDVVNPLAALLLQKVVPPLPYFTIAIMGASFAAMRLRRHRGSLDRLYVLAGILAAILITTVGTHWTAFRIVGLLLPKDRTGLCLVPLFSLILAAILAAQSKLGVDQALRYCGLAALVVADVYFMGCLRLNYFKEWRYNTDTKQIFHLLEGINHQCGISEFSVEWRYVGPLNYYRTMYDNTVMVPFVAATRPPPTDKGAYVLYYPDGEQFVKEQRLQVLYRSDTSDAAVAVRAYATGAPPSAK